MGPKTLAAMIRRLKVEQAKLAKNRDVLRELVSDYQSILDDAQEANESLEYAIDALSRLQ